MKGITFTFNLNITFILIILIINFIINYYYILLSKRFLYKE